MTTPSEDYRLIPLSQGQFSKVSPEDFEWLSRWKWHAWWSKSTNSFYALRNGVSGGRRVSIRMHREICCLIRGDDRQSDHINHDTLDNRRPNLRVVTQAQNKINKQRFRKRSGMLRGAYLLPNGRWQGTIRSNGKAFYLGCFDTAEEAHAAYREASVRYHGEFGSAV